MLEFPVGVGDLAYPVAILVVKPGVELPPALLGNDDAEAVLQVGISGIVARESAIGEGYPIMVGDIVVVVVVAGEDSHNVTTFQHCQEHS